MAKRMQPANPEREVFRALMNRLPWKGGTWTPDQRGRWLDAWCAALDFTFDVTQTTMKEQP